MPKIDQNLQTQTFCNQNDKIKTKTGGSEIIDPYLTKKSRSTWRLASGARLVAADLCNQSNIKSPPGNGFQTGKAL